MSIEHEYRRNLFTAKSKHVFFWQIKGHNSKTEIVIKSEIKLTIMVLDLVHKFQMTCLGDHQLLSKIQLWCGHTY